LKLKIHVLFSDDYSYPEIDEVMEKIVPILSENGKHEVELMNRLIRHEKNKKNVWGRTNEELFEKLNNGLKIKLESKNLEESRKEEIKKALNCCHEFYSLPQEFTAENGDRRKLYVCSKCKAKMLP